MAAQSYKVNFSGYWRELNKGNLPKGSGIYCVYSCVHNHAEKTVSLKRLIYIGEAGDVCLRISNHERLQDWARHLKKGEELCYSFGKVASTDRVRCEAALIFHHKPPENTEYVDAFPYDKTSISLEGEIKFLKDSFAVLRT